MSASTSNPNTHIHPHTDSDPNCTLEGALKTIVNVYHHYAPREGKDDELSYKDLTQLLQNQAPTFLEACVSDSQQLRQQGVEPPTGWALLLMLGPRERGWGWDVTGQGCD